MLREQKMFREEQISHFRDLRPAESVAEAEINSVLRHGASAALAEIEAALARMQRGSYGRCTVCSADITIEQLEVLPQTARCISCDCERRASASQPPSGRADA